MTKQEGQIKKQNMKDSEYLVNSANITQEDHYTHHQADNHKGMRYFLIHSCSGKTYDGGSLKISWDGKEDSEHSTWSKGGTPTKEGAITG